MKGDVRTTDELGLSVIPIACGNGRDQQLLVNPWRLPRSYFLERRFILARGRNRSTRLNSK